MPFWNDSKAQNYKAKLEHKMCIALLLQNNHISNLSSGGSLKDLSQLQASYLHYQRAKEQDRMESEIMLLQTKKEKKRKIC
ncbi:hypothetical protein HNY73_011926 [Argiope bruennichi]|uniref:Uncharacterized protein n=1 Tax=Argiope bruennichi TaxID=94029 RepID=A0A8T0EY45_ARGBR|nr:hypothetical protein HNY73_011926 [Argiope bruennichi]